MSDEKVYPLLARYVLRNITNGSNTKRYPKMISLWRNGNIDFSIDSSKGVKLKVHAIMMIRGKQSGVEFLIPVTGNDFDEKLKYIEDNFL